MPATINPATGKPYYDPSSPVSLKHPWVQIADSDPSNLEVDRIHAMDWWLFHQPNKYAIVFQPGSAADVQETEKFIRDFIAQVHRLGGRILSTRGGRPDYLNSPAVIEFTLVGDIRFLAQKLNRMVGYHEQGTKDWASSIAEMLTGKLL